METEDISVSLTGGLGNQLFQFVAAVASAGEKKVLLEIEFGKNSSSQQFEVPELVTEGIGILHGRLPNLFSKKAWNFQLSRSTKTRETTNQLGDLQLKKYLSRCIRPGSDIVVPNGVGYDPKISSLKPGSHLIGYFQTHIWADMVDVNSLIKLRSSRFDFLVTEKRAQSANPIMVHVRLGDYNKNSKIGILNRNYYSLAIEDLVSDFPEKEIWLFSNEPEEARNFIPEKFRDKMFVVHNLEMGASETLEVMRNGCAIVIGNSTFSWWAAYLAYDKNIRVIAPAKWFAMLDAPKNLYPKYWKTLDNE